MNNPYLFDGPAVISFSGGRTSGYMLYHCLQAFGGTLPENVFIVFADTGHEHPGTYKFIDQCAEAWGVTIHTVKHAHAPNETPFDALIKSKQFLPNPRMRFCTTELKITPMRKFMKDRGFDYWKNIVGIRYDEPLRIKKRAIECDKNFENYLPLALARATKPQILKFWQDRNFDLDIPAGCGNCVGCFMKGREALIAIEQRDPGALAWYQEKEKQIGGTFRPKDKRDDYKTMIGVAKNQGQLFKVSDTSIDCTCTD